MDNWLEFIGALCAVRAAVGAALWLHQYAVVARRSDGARRLLQKYGPGSWALVTGATDLRG